MQRAFLLLGLLAGVTTALSAADVAETCPHFKNPAEEIEFFNISQLKGTQRMLLPTLYVRVMHSSRNKAGDEGAEPTREITTEFSRDTLQTLAASLYEDLASRLRESGWEVITHEALQAHAGFAQLAHVEPEKNFGLPLELKEDATRASRHWIASPAGMPVIQASATGPIWAMRNILRELDAGAMIATYTFDVVAEASALIADESVATPEAVIPVPRLQLSHVSVDFYSARMNAGWMRARSAHTMDTAVIGTFAESGAKPVRAGNPFSRALSSIGNGKREGLMFVPDDTLFRQAAEEIARAFNASVLQTVQPYSPKS